MKKVVHFLAVIAACIWILITGCAGDDPSASPTAPDPPRATRVDVTPASASLRPSEATTLSAQVFDQDGRIMGSAPIQWSASDAAVASVTEAGLVTALGAGAATITAASGTVSGTASLTVVPWPVAQVVVEPDSIRITTVGGSEQLEASPLDSAGAVLAGAPVQWSSSSTDVVTVSEAGLATASGEGAATILATSGQVSVEIAVAVDFLVAGLQLAEDTVSFDAFGDSIALQVMVFDSSGTVIPTPQVDWSVRDSNVAEVSPAGLLRPLAVGGTTVLATSKGHTDSTTVIVDPVPTTVVATPDSARLNYLGAERLVVALILDRTNVQLDHLAPVWSSSDTTVASVVTSDGSTSVVAVGVGTATVLAALGALSDAIEVTVDQVAAEMSLADSSLTFFDLEASQTLSAIVADSGGTALTAPAVLWTSSAPSVVSVDAGGVVTSHQLGEATVSAGFESLSVQASVLVTERPAMVLLEADTSVAAGSAFTVRVTLDMAGRSASAGAVAVEISFEPSLVRFDTGGNVTAASLWAGLYSNADGFYRIVLSQPGGMGSAVALATIPFTVVGAPGALATLGVSVLQVIDATSFEDISAVVVGEGTAVRIR